MSSVVYRLTTKNQVYEMMQPWPFKKLGQMDLNLIIGRITFCSKETATIPSDKGGSDTFEELASYEVWGFSPPDGEKYSEVLMIRIYPHEVVDVVEVWSSEEANELLKMRLGTGEENDDEDEDDAPAPAPQPTQQVRTNGSP